jgi:NADP-dependent 3-hydroxy acid dehydrogenase YdfG
MSTGSVAIVFGASGGIGRAVVERLSGRWQVIAVAGKSTLPIEGATRTLSADVRSFAAVASAFNATDEVHSVINCAGVGYFAPVDGDYSPYWKEMFDTNVTGMLNILSHVFARRASCRDFIQIGSLACHRPSRTVGSEVYSASKAATVPLLDHFRQTLRAAGGRTRVTLVSPGFVGGTGFGSHYFDAAPAEAVDLYSSFEPLKPLDVAATIETVLGATDGLEVSTVLLRPVGQAD